MQIRRFWARGYRSLRDVEIDNLGPFNVFYGPNGSGKSNVLAAIELFSALLGRLDSLHRVEPDDTRWYPHVRASFHLNDMGNLIKPEITATSTKPAT